MTTPITIRRDPIAAARGLPSWVAQCVTGSASVTMAFDTQSEALDAAPGLMAELSAPVVVAEQPRGWEV